MVLATIVLAVGFWSAVIALNHLLWSPPATRSLALLHQDPAERPRCCRTRRSRAHRERPRYVAPPQGFDHHAVRPWAPRPIGLAHGQGQVLPAH